MLNALGLVEQKADSVQTQLNQVVIEGDSSVEAAQARVDANNKIYDTLKERLDTEQIEAAKQLTETMHPKGRSFDQPLITIITDDGRIEDLTTIKPIVDALEVKYCLAATSNAAASPGTNSLSLEQLKMFEDEGHEILSHSRSHPNLTAISDEDLDNEMRLSKEYFDSNGLNVNSFAVPQGIYNDKVKLAAQKYYRSARVSHGIYNQPPIETFELKSIWFTNSSETDSRSGYPRNSFEHYKYFIDTAVENKWWLIISTHANEIASWGFETLFEQVVAYAKSVAEIVTINQALDRVRNLFESNLYSRRTPYAPNFALSPNGDVESNLAFFKRVPPNSLTPAMLPSNFENLRCTVGTVNHEYAVANGFPGNTAGTLYTYIFNESGYAQDWAYSFQIYKIYNSDTIYYRSPKSDGTWRDWYNPADPKNQLTYSLPRGTFNGNNVPQDFVKGKKILNSFQANCPGIPFTNAGTLETDFILVTGTDWGYGKQIARVYNLTDIYVRSAISATTWSAWKKVTLENV